MPDSKIPHLFRTQLNEILADWLKEQSASLAMRSDLINEGQLKAESTAFISTLAKALESTDTIDIRATEFKPVLDLLAEISRSRTLKGFKPSETATFVFSLKSPVFNSLLTAHGNDAKALAADMSLGSQLFDRLGLYTTEVFLQTREDVIRRQQEEMLELSTPVVQLWDGIVALPLIGTLDSARTSVVMETLLQAIVQTRSEIAILDITGVPTVDTVVAQHLLKTVAAARLMGADCIISGIRPQIAQTMVHLQIDLSSVTTKATMAEALRTAIRKSGFIVTKSKTPVNGNA